MAGQRCSASGWPSRPVLHLREPHHPRDRRHRTGASTDLASRWPDEGRVPTRLAATSRRLHHGDERTAV